MFHSYTVKLVKEKILWQWLGKSWNFVKIWLNSVMLIGIIVDITPNIYKKWMFDQVAYFKVNKLHCATLNF